MARTALLGALLLALLPAAAQAAVHRPKPRLWATVNVCDTAHHPNAVGVRGSMPGAQRRSVRLYMRFRVQWHDPTDGLWHNIVRNADSGYVALGRVSARVTRQAGYLFRYQAPPAGRSLLLRGAVDAEWRIGRKVVRHERLLSASGHRSAAGSDPRRYSAATCRLRAP